MRILCLRLATVLFIVLAILPLAEAEDTYPPPGQVEIATYSHSFPYEGGIRSGVTTLILSRPEDRTDLEFRTLRLFGVGHTSQTIASGAALDAELGTLKRSWLSTVSLDGTAHWELSPTSTSLTLSERRPFTSPLRWDLPPRPNTLYEDLLLLVGRELWHPMPSGERHLLVGTSAVGLDNELFSWSVARVVREDRVFARTVPAGDFQVRHSVVTFNTDRGTRQYDLYVEAASPKRLIAWQVENSLLSGKKTVERGELRATLIMDHSVLEESDSEQIRKRLELPPLQ